MLRRILLNKKGGLEVLSGRCYSSSSLDSCLRGGVVLSFGDGSHGALGLPSSYLGLGGDAYEPTRIPGLPPHVISIGAGHYHSLAVTAQGEVWAWGRNHEFQLGRGPPLSHHTSSDSWNEPKMVQGLDEVRVRAAFGSGVVSAAIGDDGSLWVWGKSKRGQLGLGKGVTESALPSKVEALSGEYIVKVSLGWGHALAYTRDGKLFGWGYSADGRLGQIGVDLDTTSPSNNMSATTSTMAREPSSSFLEVADKLVLEQMEKEKDMPIVWEPCLVQGLDGVQVSDVACGFDHSLVLCREYSFLNLNFEGKHPVYTLTVVSDNGRLLSSGSNTYGQLGRCSTTTTARARENLGMLPVDISFQPLSISSGFGHSLAVCKINSSEGVGENNGIVSWGWNGHSQLGRLGPENSPLMVEGLVGETLVSVSGGRVHSIALTSEGQLWVWGCGKNGRLGLGSSADEAEPTMLEYLQGANVLQAASGHDHNLVLIDE